MGPANGNGSRLVSLPSDSTGREFGWQYVGPEGSCHSAAWSPDGKWMYFGVEVKGEHHLWRQRFPNGNAEQITFGPTERRVWPLSPDGRSVITSVGIKHSSLWIHDERGERPITSEGFVVSIPGWESPVTFSSDGKRIFYLMRRESPSSPRELWRTDLESGKSELVLPSFSVIGYDIASDGQEVVFSTQPTGKVPQIWLAPLDLSSAPKLIGSGEAFSPFSPYFGPDRNVLFVMRDGNTNYLASMSRDGSKRSKVLPNPISGIYGGVSPDRRWVAVSMPAPNVRTGAMFAVPTGGGASRRICEGFRPVAWSPDGKFFYIGVTRSSRSSPGKTLAIPLRSGESLPDLPASGIQGVGDTLPSLDLVSSRAGQSHRTRYLGLRLCQSDDAPQSFSNSAWKPVRWQCTCARRDSFSRSQVLECVLNSYGIRKFGWRAGGSRADYSTPTAKRLLSE